MIPTSDKYKQLTQDNARLKVSATITVQGYDANNNPIYFHFEPEQILSFDYHIWEDPVGRELPGIELKWTEFYAGRIDEDSVAEKYKAALPLMRVDATLSQDMVNSSAETFPLQSLFLVGTPEVNGQIITWTARDLISFLNDPFCRFYEWEISDQDDVYEYSPIIFSLLQERRNMSKYSLNYLLTFTYNLYNLSPMLYGIGGSIYLFLNGSTKDCLLNYYTAKNKYLSYRYTYIDDPEAGVTIEPDYGDYHSTPSSLHLFDFADALTPSENIIDCPIRLMKDYPKVTNGSNISAYNYTEHITQVGWDRKKVKDIGYEKKNLITADGTTLSAIHVLFDGLWAHQSYVNKGYIITELSGGTFDFEKRVPSYMDFNPTVLDIANVSESAAANTYIYPMLEKETEHTINLNQDGEVFTEDSPIPNEDISIRTNNLTSWFNSNNRSIEFTQLPNLAIEVGDTISVETNMYRNNKRVKYLAYVVDIQLQYNGGLWQKIICHTIGVDEREANE